MNLMKLLDYYKATFPGEIFEKTKRKILISTNLFLDNKKKVPKDISVSKYFYLNEKSKEFKSLDNYFEIFNFKINLLEPINWEILDKDKNKEWFKIKISDYKDIKYTWEINRLQFLLPLAISNNKKRGLEILDSWIEENKFLKGPNRCSNLEVAIRSVSILNFLNYINDNKIIEKYKNHLYQHAQYIYREIFYTEKCIPNNHLVGEAAALYCLSKFFKSTETSKWEDKSKKVLKKYLSHIREDGTYLEASLSYHRFFLQMYIMVYLYSKKTKDNFLEKEIEEILKKSFVFLKSIEKPNRKYPDFGDNDEGYFYKILLNKNFYSFVDSLEYILWPTTAKENNELKFLFEEIYNMKLKEKEKTGVELKDFFSKGKFIVKKENNNYFFINNQSQIFHTHSDGLSIELMLEGKEILTDSGTFNYNLNKDKRNYYRGTKSHNTILLDNSDQSKQIGSFRWIHEAKSSLHINKIENIVKIVGEIKTKNRANHLRTVKLEKDFGFIEIIDEVKNVKALELNWHFAEGIELKKIKNGEYKIIGTDYIISIENSFSTDIILAKSLYSNSYGKECLRENIRIKNIEIKNTYILKTIIRSDK